MLPRRGKELGGKLSLQEIKREQLERAKAEQRAAAEKLKRDREGKTEDCTPKPTENASTSENPKTVESDEKTVPSTITEELTEMIKPSIWLCLRCGSQGCGKT